MKHVLIAVSATALTLAGCGGSRDEAADVVVATPGATVTDVTPAVVSPSQAFANAAAANDTFTIETSRLVAASATSPGIKKFADDMIKAHTDSTAKLNTAAASATPSITPAAQLTPAQQRTLDELKLKTGADFDRAYAQAQVDAHQTALNTLRDYSTNGDVPALRQFATDQIPTVTAHLNLANNLK